MRHLNDYITSTHDQLKGREEIEWLNFWYSEANSTPPYRIIFIGDSTGRMIRSTLEKQLKAPVDFIGTSCGLHDVLFVSQIDSFFSSSKYIYSAIFVQLGHHSIRNGEGEIYTEADYDRYRQDLYGLIHFLKQFTDNILLLSCFQSVIPYPRGYQKGFKRRLVKLNGIEYYLENI